MITHTTIKEKVFEQNVVYILSTDGEKVTEFICWRDKTILKGTLVDGEWLFISPTWETFLLPPHIIRRFQREGKLL